MIKNLGVKIVYCLRSDAACSDVVSCNIVQYLNTTLHYTTLHYQHTYTEEQQNNRNCGPLKISTSLRTQIRKASRK